MFSLDRNALCALAFFVQVRTPAICYAEGPCTYVAVVWLVGLYQYLISCVRP